jgi:predicted metal-binding membrane protein
VQTSVDVLPGVERLIRRDRVLTGIALGVVILLSWIYLYQMTAGMHAAAAEADMHAAMGMSEMAAWGPWDVLALFAMWAVMMAGMMLPSAAPIILLVIGTYRRRGGW